jgi:glycosyltransferase involved in cell wall biosynthesis
MKGLPPFLALFVPAGVQRVAVQPDLSVVVPLHNSQRSIADKVETLLEVLPDLTPRFEILVIDNGSDDHTLEVAHELARVYPQVGVAKHAGRSGPNEIVETALRHTTGEILFVQDENAPIDSARFRRLWSVRTSDRVVIPLAKLRSRPSLMKRLVAWGVRLEDVTRTGEGTGLQMIRRPTRPAGRPPACAEADGSLSRIDACELDRFAIPSRQNSSEDELRFST